MDRQLPHNLDSEKIVIGSIISDINAYSEVSPVLQAEMFYNQFHKELYEEIERQAKKGKIPDLVLLCDKYSGNTTAISNIVDISGCFSVDYYSHALNIQEKFVRRRLWALGSQLASDVYSPKDTNDLLNSIQRDLSLINQEVASSEITTLNDAIKGVFKQIEVNLSGDHLSGTDTGFKTLNKATGGLQKGNLIIVAGSTSNGKSSLAIALTETAARQGHGVAFYSLEMTAKEIASRHLAMNSGVPSKDILYSKLEPEYIELLDKGANRLHDLPIYFDDNSTSNIDQIIASIRSMKSKYDITGAVVDYLQILNVNQSSTNKEQVMGDVARRLKNLAKELNIWVIALSQLNRDNLNPVPNLNRLRDSGQIAEAADIVMFVYRPELYGKFFPEPFNQYDTKGKAMIDVAKGRNIGLLKFICDFDAKTTHFKEFTETFQIQETPF
jgi:replicative DNA helicase